MPPMGWRGDVQSRVLGSDFSLPVVPVQIPETKCFKLSFNDYYSVPGVLYTSAIRTGAIEHLWDSEYIREFFLLRSWPMKQI